MMLNPVKNPQHMNVENLQRKKNQSVQYYSHNVISTELVSTCVMDMDIKNYQMNNKEQSYPCTYHQDHKLI